MAKLYNLARMTTATTGTGTIVLGSAVSGYLTFGLAGVADGDIVDYGIKDTAASEIGTGTYTASGTTLTRSVTRSTNSNSAINLSGAAEVFITPRAETLNDASLITTGTMATARLGSGTASSSTALFGDQTYKTITVNGLISVVEYSSTQTITIPAGATRAFVKLWGGSGGGGGINGNAASGAGGGAGALQKYLTGLTAGNTLALTLGAAGAAGTTTTDGGAGGNSTLASGTQTITTLTANGGAGGKKNVSGGLAVLGGAGGSATNGDRNISGTNGGSGLMDSSSTPFAAGTSGVTGMAMSFGAPGVFNSVATAGIAGTIGGCTIEWYS